MCKRILLFVVLLVLTARLTAQASVVFTFDSLGGAVSGTLGSIVGWGYSVTNETSDWVVLTASAFSPLPGWGAYNHYFTDNFVLLAPGATDTQPFTATGPTTGVGVGYFVIDSKANPGATTTGGAITLSYDRYDGDPTDGGNYLSPAAVTDPVAASVTVLDATAVPEPTTCILLTLGLGVVGYVRRRVTRNEI